VQHLIETEQICARCEVLTAVLLKTGVLECDVMSLGKQFPMFSRITVTLSKV
jgi:hypothetical protein